MNRLNHLRSEVGGSDASNVSDTGFHTASDSTAGSSNFFSFTDDSNTPKKQEKEIALSESTPRPAIVDSGFGVGLSPIPQNDRLGFGHIDAKNILSGGIEIFEDCNSNDGDGLVIDDDAVNVNEDTESASIGTSEKVICEPNESANLLLNEDPLPLKEIPSSSESLNKIEEISESTENQVNNNEVILQIDGKNVDALDLGNGLYLYRKEEGGELHAIQILQEDGQPQFKFLKVRQIGESNLEVYEEQILEVPITNEELEEQIKKERKEDINKPLESGSHLPISDVKKALGQSNLTTAKTLKLNAHNDKSVQKMEVSQNSNMAKKVDVSGDFKNNPLKNVECSRKSPILGTFTSMTLHSSSKKEGAPPTKTKINLPINSTRNIDSIKKTIEVSTDNLNLKNIDKNSIVKSNSNKDALKAISEPNTDKNIEKQKEDLKLDQNLDKKINTIPTTSQIKSKLTQDVRKNINIDKNLSLDDDVMECCINHVNVENKKDVHKSETKLKSVDNKKDTNPSKPNVVSKWVLRSDSIDEKSKKEREKFAVDAKPVNSSNIKSTSDSYAFSRKDSVKTYSEDKFKKGHASGKVEEPEELKCKERVTKVVPKTPLIIESKTPHHSVFNNALKNARNHKEIKSQNLFSNKTNPQTLHKGLDVNKTLSSENKSKDTAPTFDFVNKYINKAFRNISSTENNLKTGSKPDNEHVNKTLNMCPKDEEKISSASALHVSVESSNKPVPFGKWTEDDKQIYLNKLKDQKFPSVATTLSSGKSCKSVMAKSDLRKLEMKKNPKVESFENVFLSKIESDVPAISQENKTAKDVDMKGIIDTAITGFIMKTLSGPAGQPPALNHPCINIAHSAAIANEKQELNKDVKKQIESGSKETKLSEMSTSENSNITHCKMPDLLPLKGNLNKTESPAKKILSNIDDDDSEDEDINSEPVTGEQWPLPAGKEGQKVTIAELQKMIESKNKESKSLNKSSEKSDKKFVSTDTKIDSLTKESQNPVNSKNKLINDDAKLSEKIDNKFKDVITPTSYHHASKNITTVSDVQTVSSNVQNTVNINKISTKANNNLTSDNAQTYHRKVQLAYQSALSEKNLKTPPIKILDNQIVKTPNVTSTFEQVQNTVLSNQNIEKGNKKVDEETDKQFGSDKNSTEIGISKIKHQRKQILSCVETPPIEIIEPINVLDVNYTKKRKYEIRPTDVKTDISDQPKKDFKFMTPKKNYLLGRSSAVADEIKKDEIESVEFSKKIETKDQAIDNSDDKTNVDSTDQNNTPKRGRGRPRKQPINNNLKKESSRPTTTTSSGENSSFDNTSSLSSVSVDEEDESDEEGIPRENWTMSKINDKIVCPICNKLFRSENIVFKHVKHCSTVIKSPTKRFRDSENITEIPIKKGKNEQLASEDCESSNVDTGSNLKYKKPAVENDSKPQEIDKKTSEIILLDTPKTNVIVIEDSPQTVTKPVKYIEKNYEDVDKPKNKVGRPRSTVTHACDVCSKTFRQLSYLEHHRSQHKNPKLPNPIVENKPLSCEVCHKEFRKLYHLVEHREIHNQSSSMLTSQRKSSVDKNNSELKESNVNSNSNLKRKSSEEKVEPKKEPEQSFSKTIPKSDELTAGFRCEPCDKSFRKLHHLVEHRETHDGLLKQKSPPQVSTPEKTFVESPTCEVCGKSFRKLHHLIEHREQHSEANIEKRERKSLLAKDIIHECSLCYMVFPNEPSLNKHIVNCQKKKNRSLISSSPEENRNEPKASTSTAVPERDDDKTTSETSTSALVKTNSPVKRSSKDISESDNTSEAPNKQLKNETTSTQMSSVRQKKSETNTKKPAKVGLASKRLRNSLPSVPEEKAIESKESDDEARYMINPSYRAESEEEKEVFMNICVVKRNSLHFESPSAETEFKKRRTSLQNPPRNQKLPNKKTDTSSQNASVEKNKQIKLETRSNSSVPSTSKDSVNNNSLRSTKTRHTVIKATTESEPQVTSNKRKDEERTKKTEKRKSLTGIAKRKSLGKSVGVKPALPKTAPSTAKKEIKKVLQHVCDCGAPFSSVTLLAQHTSVAHTPPRARRPRPPPPPRRSRIPSQVKHAGVPVALKQRK